jgi:hypothetical protein
VKDVTRPTDDGRVPVTGKRQTPLVCRADGTGAYQFRLLAPHPARARVHPRGAGTTIVIRPRGYKLGATTAISNIPRDHSAAVGSGGTSSRNPNQANRDMTGLRSIATLVWSFMLLIVLILALVPGT